MTYISVFIAALIPAVLIIFPGSLISTTSSSILGRTARIILWSITLLTLSAFASALLRLPITIIPGVTILIALSFYIYKKPHPSFVSLRNSLVIILPAALIFFAFSLPFLNFHNGLPTGDSQKSIYWANKINQRNSLPDYSIAKEQLNRDPVDFYTPGLHSLTALASKLSLHPLVTIGFLAITLSLATSIIAGALVYDFTGHKSRIAVTLLTILFVLTHLRFLRYLREPGYHFQNVVGELLLFGLLYLSLNLLSKWDTKDFFLLILIASSLVLSHQFSSFLAPFVILPVIITATTSKWSHLISVLNQNKKSFIVLAVFTLLLFIGGLMLGLHQKIPHIFTLSPHLLPLTPNISNYPELMGIFWITISVLGLLLSLRNISHQPPTTNALLFSSLVLLLLSQGPRLGINIPPVRALFYSVVPLSIFGAIFMTNLLIRAKKINNFFTRTAAIIALLLILAVFPKLSVNQAFNLSHSVRTNSTLLPEYLPLIDTINEIPGGILIDDFNRRSASWLILGNQPMFTRITADLARQMSEARQSQERYNLYLKQLDYEKIFALGSYPSITQLMNKHNITKLTGIHEKSDTSFKFNKNLTQIAQGADVLIYQSNNQELIQNNTTNWLLKASTLANDIGDNEDTFEHLPASLRSTRLSGPQTNEEFTYRTTTAPYIPLKFNVGDYVQILWDKENTGIPDISVAALVKYSGSEEPLTISTTANTKYQLRPNQLIRIAATDVIIGNDGFITLTINNPEELPIDIDLIALGLARTP